MAVLTAQQIIPAGTAVTFASASGGGDRVPVGATNFVRVKNGSGSSITVTVNSVKPCDQGFDHDLAVAVAAGATTDIGPLTPGRFTDTDGLAGVTYSSVTAVTVAAVFV
jgi:hypothetical protein